MVQPCGPDRGTVRASGALGAGFVEGFRLRRPSGNERQGSRSRTRSERTTSADALVAEVAPDA